MPESPLPARPDFDFFAAPDVSTDRDSGDELDLEYTYPKQPETVTRVTVDGYLPANDIRRAFVMGAKWWEYHSTGFTMFGSDRNLAEAEAEKRYPGGTSTDADELETVRRVTNLADQDFSDTSPEYTRGYYDGLAAPRPSEDTELETLRAQLTAARLAYHAAYQSLVTDNPWRVAAVRDGLNAIGAALGVE